MVGPFLMICDDFFVADVMFDNIMHHDTQVFYFVEMLAPPMFQRVHNFIDQ